MRPLIILMLSVELGIFLATAFAVAFRRPSATRPRPVWSSLAISLFVVATTALRIGADYVGDKGATELRFCAAILIGMGVMCLLMFAAQRRGLATVERDLS